MVVVYTMVEVGVVDAEARQLFAQQWARSVFETWRMDKNRGLLIALASTTPHVAIELGLDAALLLSPDELDIIMDAVESRTRVEGTCAYRDL